MNGRMGGDFSNSGDLNRSVELLWRRQEPGRRGPKQRLSTEEVVQTAIRLADAHGLEALSMRKVAQEMGVTPMSLYTYVPSKAELVDLMFDRVLAEDTGPGAALEGWRAKLAFIARERWALNERHPWLLDLALHRPPLGPNVLRRAETAMNALDGMGLGLEDMAMAAEALQNYVVGALHAARAAGEVEQRSGMTDEQWFAAIEEMLKGRADPGSFPAMARLSQARRLKAASPEERQARFEFGLQRMLDGLEAFLNARRAAT